MSKLWRNVVGLSATAVMLAALPVGSASAGVPSAGAAVASVVAADWVQVGNWKSSRRYHAGDVVRYRGKSYVAIKTNKNKKPRGSKKWRVVAADGATGPTGPTGATGATGPMGSTGPVGPNWVVRDSSGKVMGQYLGMQQTYIGMLTYYVLAQGGAWPYAEDGSYGIIRFNAAGAAGPAALLQASPKYLDPSCGAPAYLWINAQTGPQYQAAVGGMGREVYVTKDGYEGFKLAGPTVPVAEGTPIYGWAGEPGARTCELEMNAFPGTVFFGLASTPLPPAAASGPLSVGAP